MVVCGSSEELGDLLCRERQTRLREHSREDAAAGARDLECPRSSRAVESDGTDCPKSAPRVVSKSKPQTGLCFAGFVTQIASRRPYTRSATMLRTE